MLDGPLVRRHLGQMSHSSDQSRSIPADEGHLDPQAGSGQANQGDSAAKTDAFGRPLSPAAQRALAEAAARRAAIDARAAAIAAQPESDGRGGLEPVRYEDWEIKGRAVDF
jgi:hypothetical protein